MCRVSPVSATMSGWRPAAAGLLVLAGGGLAAASSLAWTSAGLGSTRSLAQLADLVGSGVVDETWAKPLLLLPTVVGAATAVAGCVVLASAWGIAARRWVTICAGAVLVGQMLAAVAAAGLVAALDGGPVHAPGPGAMLAASCLLLSSAIALALLVIPAASAGEVAS